MIIHSEAEMVQYGEQFGAQILHESKIPTVIELVGDVGAGKTTFTRGLAKGLGVQAELSSPSFTISKLYAGDGCILAHYDFYRLTDPGLMSEDLAESVNDPKTVTVIEWGQNIHEILPAERTTITIKYQSETERLIIIRRHKNKESQ